jgi:uncharacterized protein (DUF305 family)
VTKFVLVLTALALLTGCAQSNNTAVPPTDHMSQMPSIDASANTEDIMFTQMMIPHHSQAVEMSGFAKTRTTNAEVLALAAKISAAQQPEIDLMSGWLHSWGIHTMPGMHHMDTGTDGMLNDSQIADLKAARGKEFDSFYLTGMLAHHHGAIAMAKDALASGQNSDVQTLARNIVTSQNAEIMQITAMLKQLS